MILSTFVQDWKLQYIQSYKVIQKKDHSSQNGPYNYKILRLKTSHVGVIDAGYQILL